jgi:hypothetical protein
MLMSPMVGLRLLPYVFDVADKKEKGEKDPVSDDVQIIYIASSGGSVKKAIRTRSSYRLVRIGDCQPGGVDPSSTYEGQFRDHYEHGRHEIEDEVGQIVVSEVRAQEKQADRHRKEELLRGGVLIAVVNLLPEIEMIVCAGVEFERDTSDVMEHDE